MFTKKLSQIQASDTNTAGGKGASLGEMIRAGFPIPPGFIVLASAFDTFIDDNNLRAEIDAVLHAVNQKAIHTVVEASEKIRAIIESAPLSEELIKEIEHAFSDLNVEYVAVRSSATSEDSADATWAGQLETYLNTSKDQLLKNVKKCWSSLFTPNAIFYRFEKGLHGAPLSVAVVVQKMVDSEKSGIAFSVHPVTQDRNQLIIEAGFGLGEAIVSGEITPDSYSIEKDTDSIIQRNINVQTRALTRGKNGMNVWKELGEVGLQSVLDQKEILTLTELVKRVEINFGFPVDVEWAFENGEFFITQSRRITTLEPNSVDKDEYVKSKMHLENTIDFTQFEYWTEEAHVPLFILSESRISCFSDDILCLYKDGTSLLFLTKERWKKEGQIGRLEVSRKDFLTSYAKQTEAVIQKIIDDGKQTGPISFEELMQLYIAWQDVYFQVDPPRTYLVGDADLDREGLKIIAETRLQLRVVAEEILFEMTGKFIERLHEDNGVNPHDLYFYLESEIHELVRDQKKVKQTVIHKRQEGYVFLRKNGVSRIFVGKEYQRALTSHEYWLNKQYHDRVITGMIANRGLVRGQVQVIKHDRYDINEAVAQFIPGRILVTEMTRPQTIAACKEAKAIVTDEGGIVCHASIISREYGIPCIVGTKIATHILKDGDTIEVDANKGIVTVLKSVQI